MQEASLARSRLGSGELRRRKRLLGSLVIATATTGCYTGVDSPPVLDQCGTGTDGPELGAWDTDVEDWSDPGATGGNEEIEDACGIEVLEAHHCFSTPVHAIHMHTGELMVMHGEGDQRVWPIGAAPSAMAWHPLPFTGETPGSSSGFADLFCTGHSQLADGRVLFAGGNINGSAAAGGIRDAFLFDPVGAPGATAANLCPFGWEFDETAEGWENQVGRMEFDRWYPTLTTLPDGRVLIAGGLSSVEPSGGSCDETSDCDAGEICNVNTSTCQPQGPTCPASVACVDDAGCADACGESEQEQGDCGSAVCEFQQCGCGADWTCHAPTNTCQPGREDAVNTRVLEVFDPSQPPASAFSQIAELFPGTEGVPNYPFMFVLPNGDVLYAGSEEASTDAEVDGHILVVDYDGDATDESEWGHRIDSLITGGSAVMFQPGMVLKAGGRSGDALESDHQVATSEVVDLRGFASGDYANAPTEFSLAAEMTHARHYHTLTVLPTGHVLATGGNDFGISNAATDHFSNPLEDDEGTPIESFSCDDGCPSLCVNRGGEHSIGLECGTLPDEFVCSLLGSVPCNGDETCGDTLPGASCVAGRCRLACSEEELGMPCGIIEGCGPGGVLRSPRDDYDEPMCGAMNNAYYATREAEIYDPQCNTWTPLGEQEFERMYHGNALLMPDGRVLSMGSGHRTGMREGVIQEYFAPQYAVDPAAPVPEVSLVEFGVTLGGDPPLDPTWNYLPWDGELDVIVENDVPIGSAALVRLGSATHGFDMNQRWVPLFVSGEGSPYRVFGFPTLTPNTAPPGWYMLFLMSEAGEPGRGQYVRVGDDTDMEYVCEASELLARTELSCAGEPSSGVCASQDEVTVELPLPSVPSGTGMVDGFRVIAPAGLVEDHDHPSADELAALERVCQRACEDSVAGWPGVSANCGDSGVFAAITRDAAGHRASELVRADHRHGEDLFASQALDCDLVDECHQEFDEVLDAHGPRRVSPAHDVLHDGEEWALSISGTVGAMSTHSQGQVTAAMTGEIGYSLCRDGNQNGPCPFYLGSMHLELTSPLTLVMQCDGQAQTHVLSSLSLDLAEPAYGIAEQNTQWRAFPPGALMFEAEGVVDGLPFASRRPTQEPLYMRAAAGWSMVQGTDGAWLEFTAPCGEESAEVLVWWGYNTVAVDEHPPYASIGVPSTISCPSTPTLTGTASDLDADIVSKRWFVDGVLLEDETTQLHFTQSHTLRLEVRDARGATASAEKAVVCQ